MSKGLESFLEKIKNSPQNQTYVERFLALIIDEPSKSRLTLLYRLGALIVTAQPLVSLKVSHMALKEARAMARPMDEIEVLKLVEACFVSLGKRGKAAVVAKERALLEASVRKEDDEKSSLPIDPKETVKVPGAPPSPNRAKVRIHVPEQKKMEESSNKLGPNVLKARKLQNRKEFQEAPILTKVSKLNKESSFHPDPSEKQFADVVPTHLQDSIPEKNGTPEKTGMQKLEVDKRKDAPKKIEILDEKKDDVLPPIPLGKKGAMQSGQVPPPPIDLSSHPRVGDFWNQWIRHIQSESGSSVEEKLAAFWKAMNITLEKNQSRYFIAIYKQWDYEKTYDSFFAMIAFFFENFSLTVQEYIFHRLKIRNHLTQAWSDYLVGLAYHGRSRHALNMIISFTEPSTNIQKAQISYAHLKLIWKNLSYVGFNWEAREGSRELWKRLQVRPTPKASSVFYSSEIKPKKT